MTTEHGKSWIRVVVSACLAGLLGFAQAATIQIINIDGPGVGFNDPTPAAPVGGNPGTTLGQQRLNVFDFVANFWGRRLNSDVPIQVLSTFDALPCDSSSGVLGAAGALFIWANTPNAKANTWYPQALANKLAAVQVNMTPDPVFGSADIIAFFNGDLGKTGCLDGLSFYLGLDGNADPISQIDLVTTVLHEFGHGLGFQTFTDDATGAQVPSDEDSTVSFPSIWDYFLFDPQQRKTWAQMTDAERVTSAITPRNLVWNGKQVTKDAHKVLNRGTPELFVAGGGLNKFYFIGTAEFGPAIDKHTLISSEMARVVDQADGRGLACTALDATNAKAVKGKVAIIDRGSCAFTVKVKNAQLAGAKAVIIADNVVGTPPPNLSGTDATITIPAVRVTRDDGAEIKAAVAATPPRRIGPIAVLFDNQLKLAGADFLQRVFMFTPNPNQPGSSVSHYDTLATPNLLMEPFAEPNQPIAVAPPKDLTLPLLRDIGWDDRDD